MIITLLKSIPVGLVTLLCSVIALVSIPLDRSGKTYHWSARAWARFILWIFGIRISVRGEEHLEPSRHYIYVSNHASGFDIPVVLAGINDQVRIVLKKELTRIPIWGWALKWGYYIPIDRSNPKTALQSLRRRPAACGMAPRFSCSPRGRGPGTGSSSVQARGVFPGREIRRTSCPADDQSQLPHSAPRRFTRQTGDRQSHPGRPHPDCGP